MAVTISDKQWERLVRTMSAIRNDLNELKKSPGKQTWVKAKEIMDITGWDAEGMRKARELGYVSFREPRPKVYEYLLESLSDDFKTKKTA